MTEKKVTVDNLNDVMEFDHVIRVNADGTVIDSPDSPYFDVHMVEVSEGHWEDEFSIPDGWQLMSGYTGQYGYNGPVMHQSEFIGGRMARDILEMPGDYVALVVETMCAGEPEDADTLEDNSCDCEPAGWVVAFKPLEVSE